MKLNKIILGDALESLRDIEKESIDLICIDPPYGINKIGWDKKLNCEDELYWNILISSFDRILKPHGQMICFAGWSNVDFFINKFKCHFHFKNWIIWDRIKGRGAKTNLMSTREDILWFIKNENRYTFNKISSNIKKKTKGMGLKNGNKYRALSNVWTDISPIVPWSREWLDHPTQKPLKLLERIIKIWSNENDIVLDCFAGSGTTGEACKNLNRNFILIDSDPYYNKIMNLRLN